MRKASHTKKRRSTVNTTTATAHKHHHHHHHEADEVSSESDIPTCTEEVALHPTRTASDHELSAASSPTLSASDATELAATAIKDTAQQIGQTTTEESAHETTMQAVEGRREEDNTEPADEPTQPGAQSYDDAAISLCSTEPEEPGHPNVDTVPTLPQESFAAKPPLPTARLAATTSAATQEQGAVARLLQVADTSPSPVEGAVHHCVVVRPALQERPASAHTSASTSTVPSHGGIPSPLQVSMANLGLNIEPQTLSVPSRPRARPSTARQATRCTVRPQRSVDLPPRRVQSAPTKLQEEVKVKSAALTVVVPAVGGGSGSGVVTHTCGYIARPNSGGVTSTGSALDLLRPASIELHSRNDAPTPAASHHDLPDYLKQLASLRSLRSCLLPELGRPSEHPHQKTAHRVPCTVAPSPAYAPQPLHGGKEAHWLTHWVVEAAEKEKEKGKEKGEGEVKEAGEVSCEVVAANVQSADVVSAGPDSQQFTPRLPQKPSRVWSNVDQISVRRPCSAR